MNRIDKLFQTKRKEILSVYFCAGYPASCTAGEVIKALAGNGADMIEIGIPFSDPMADGPVIQHAASCALRGGMSLRLLFEQLQGIRKKTSVPLVMMGYLNPVMQYGFENFCRSCSRCGVDGMIIPDLPLTVYREEYFRIAHKYDLKVIMLITPETSPERIRLIDEYTGGFIYMVSSAAVTGSQKDFDDRKEEYFKRVAGMSLKNPLMVGFGISNKRTYDAAVAHAAGAIIGSKYISLLEEYRGDPQAAAGALLEAIGKAPADIPR